MRRGPLGNILQGIPLSIQVLLVAGTAFAMFAVLQFGLPAASQIEQPTPRVWPTPAFTDTPLPGTLTQASTATHTATVTPRATRTPGSTPGLQPPPGGIVYALQPNVNRVGWVISGDDDNYFGTSYLYTGFYNGRIYHGTFQFDLSFLPPGSTIHYAAIELTGLDDSTLSGDQGRWSLNMLAPEIDPNWPLHAYREIHDAQVAFTLSPLLTSADLAAGKTNAFVFDAGERAELERRIATGVISFRLDGPSSGVPNMFSWDTGYGNATQGHGPVLRIAVAPPEVPVTPTVERVAGLGTPTPTYVIITSVPTPANALTAAADALTATAWATIVGTPTPLPMNWVTPIIVTPTPEPLNTATASARAALATAKVLLTGTPTPTPGNVWTATPTPTWVVVTLEPTPENLLTAAADALTATSWAVITGTYTPIPSNWVTPIIVTATPEPANPAEATRRSEIATAQALLTGTAMPTPLNMWVVTHTPTPIYIYLWDLPPVERATPTPWALPRGLAGRIGFMSDRRGSPAYYMMDANGRNVALFTSPWIYEFSQARQVPGPGDRGHLSPNGQLILYVEGEVGHRQIWIANADGSSPHNISNNPYDEYAPVWLRADTVAPPPITTPTPPPAPAPTPTPAPPPAPRVPTATPKPTPPPPA